MLVYEFMPNGTLRDHLSGTSFVPPSDFVILTLLFWLFLHVHFYSKFNFVFKSHDIKSMLMYVVQLLNLKSH